MQQDTSSMNVNRGPGGISSRKRIMSRIYPGGTGDGGITIHEKRMLGLNIKKLPSEFLQGVVRIVF